MKKNGKICILIGFCILFTLGCRMTISTHKHSIIVGSYLHNEGENPLGLAGFEYAYYCPVVFTRQSKVYFCDYGWGMYAFQSKNELKLIFPEITVHAMILEMDTDHIIFEIDSKVYSLFKAERIPLFGLRLKGEFCRPDSIYNQNVTGEYWHIDNREICITIFEENRKECSSYEIINGNTIRYEHGDRVFVFYEVWGLNDLSFRKFGIYESHKLNQLFVKCDIEGAYGWFDQ